MAIPAYLWLKHDGGAPVIGAVDVKGRGYSIEVTSFSHHISIPTDGNIQYSDTLNERVTG